MRKIIHHIRKQPEEIRRHILHVLTIVSAVILLFLWVYSLGTSLGDVTVEVKESDDLQPLSALKGNIIGGYQNIVNGSSPNTSE